MTTSLADLRLAASGKVREIYEDGDELIMVASDRISVYDVILPTEIPDKGKVLTQMSLFWFELTGDIVPQPLHLLTSSGGRRARHAREEARDIRSSASAATSRDPAGGSTASPGPSAHRPARGADGVRQAAGAHLHPATKAELGEHDENIDFERAVEIIGSRPPMDELRRISIEIYEKAAEHAAERGIIVADTKFEFGSSPGAEVVLADEVLTPDSSRFWPADDYEPGRSQASFDKQYVRDYADSVGWDHTEPGPELPDEVVQNTRAKYVRPTSGSRRKLDW
jgi:phosphoribosylaminoimidazole-succinocarboxamide synthase